MADIDRLYRINDVLSGLAQELGVEVTDEVLDDLTHHVAATFEEPRKEA